MGLETKLNKVYRRWKHMGQMGNSDQALEMNQMVGMILHQELKQLEFLK
jgi:hypothetical protein